MKGTIRGSVKNRTTNYWCPRMTAVDRAVKETLLLRADESGCSFRLIGKLVLNYPPFVPGFSKDVREVFDRTYAAL